MLCTIYKSPKKIGTYLYIERRDDFERVPKALLATFGTPILVMVIDLGKKQKLALVDKARVIAALVDQGFYLQLPPPEENLLEVHLSSHEKGQESK